MKEISVKMHKAQPLTYKELAPYEPPELWVENTEQALITALRESNFIDGAAYLAQYEDVRNAQMDPFEHYVRYGQYESRELKYKPNVSLACNKVFRHGTLETLYDDSLAIQWIITSMCNYDCSYCFYHEKLNKRNFSDFDTLKTIADNIYLLNRSIYKFNIIGGEPTTHPALSDLITYISEKFTNKLSYINIISNGSSNHKLYDHIFNLADKVNFQLCISLHMDFLKIGQILSLIEHLAHKATINFNFMLNPDKREFMREVFAALLEKRLEYPFFLNLSILLSGEHFDKVDPRYSKADFAWRTEALKQFNSVAVKSKAKGKWRSKSTETPFWDHALHGVREFISGNPLKADRGTMLAKGVYNFKNMWCVQSSSLLVVQPNGAAGGCLCGQNESKLSMLHGNAFQHDEFIRPVKCLQENCGCCMNDLLQKFSSFAEADAFARQFKEKQKKLFYRH